MEIKRNTAKPEEIYQAGNIITNTTIPNSYWMVVKRDAVSDLDSRHPWGEVDLSDGTLILFDSYEDLLHEYDEGDYVVDATLTVE